jgi:L-lactate dehydrogenase complex protein LldG
MADAKERILGRIKQALQRQDPQPYEGEDLSGPVFAASDDPLDVLFAERFTAAGGKFFFAESPLHLIQALQELFAAKGWTAVACRDEALRLEFTQAGLPSLYDGQDLEPAQAGLSRCESLVARTGSILLSSRLASGRALPIYPPVQVVVADTAQLVPDIAEGLTALRQRHGDHLPSLINLATGPSRTADIEKTLVLGAHGPREVYVFLLDRP